MTTFDAAHYGPVFAELIPPERVMPLDEGRPHAAARDALVGLSVEQAFGHGDVVDRDMAQCCLAAVWLLHDFLDESHTISQSIGTPSGSYWHGIMHRREGDFSNAKYWFRRVGPHPVFEQLTQSDGTPWNASSFVDRCSRALGGRSKESLAELCQLQHREWQALFAYCYRAAIGEREA